MFVDRIFLFVWCLRYPFVTILDIYVSAMRQKPGIGITPYSFSKYGYSRTMLIPVSYFCKQFSSKVILHTSYTAHSTYIVLRHIYLFEPLFLTLKLQPHTMGGSRQIIRLFSDYIKFHFRHVLK
jgi:hypothetical protein